MPNLSKNLRNSLLGIRLTYFLAGIAVLCTAYYFLLTPMKRRAALFTREQLYISISIAALMIVSSLVAIIGIFSNRVSKYALKLDIMLLAIAILMTLFLGSYIWFETLNVRQSYQARWYSWSDEIKLEFQNLGMCCGYENVMDDPVISSSCTEEAIKIGEFFGCSESVYSFVNEYLQNIYTLMFAYVFAGTVAFFSSLMLLRIIKDQDRYEKSMFKLINMHQLSTRASYRSTPRQSHRLSSYPTNFKHASVIYESKVST